MAYIYIYIRKKLDMPRWQNYTEKNNRNKKAEETKRQKKYKKLNKKVQLTKFCCQTNLSLWIFDTRYSAQRAGKL